MTISWYFISISLKAKIGILLENRTIFEGYFSVDDFTNLVTSFYEIINKSTNFNNDIL